MISINATLIVQMIQFLILLYILNRIMIKPIMKLITEREQHIEKINEDIQHTKEETERLVSESISREKDAGKEAANQASQLKQEGKNEVATFIEEAQKEALSVGEEAMTNVTAEIEKVRPTLKDEADALVDELAEKVVGRRI